MTKHILGDVADIIQGKCKAYILGGTQIVVYNVGGTFFATQHHCSHKGAQLANGILQGDVIQCVQHGWKFDVKTGTCLAPGHGRKLRCYPVTVEHASIVVELHEEDVKTPAGKVRHSRSTGKITFHAVAKAADLEDDDVMSVIIERDEFALYRMNGAFYATHGLCTHESVRLCEGFVCDGEIECPLHGARFNIKTGEATSLPAEIPLKTFPVKLEEGIVYIGIESG